MANARQELHIDRAKQRKVKLARPHLAIHPGKRFQAWADKEAAQCTERQIDPQDRQRRGKRPALYRFHLAKQHDDAQYARAQVQ